VSMSERLRVCVSAFSVTGSMAMGKYPRENCQQAGLASAG